MQAECNTHAARNGSILPRLFEITALLRIDGLWISADGSG
jgi:hypothetical protein